MNTERFFIMRSQTSAIRAKRLLSARGISANAFKSTSSDGCSYGVSVFARDHLAARLILSEGGISFSEAENKV